MVPAFVISQSRLIHTKYSLVELSLEKTANARSTNKQKSQTHATQHRPKPSGLDFHFPQEQLG